MKMPARFPQRTYPHRSWGSDLAILASACAQEREGALAMGCEARDAICRWNLYR